MVEINLGNTVPLFAHDVALSTITKTRKTKKGNVRRESFTELVFIDAIRKSAIARIMLPFDVFKGLPNLIEENIKKRREEMKNKDIADDSKEKTEIKTISGTYVG